MRAEDGGGRPREREKVERELELSEEKKENACFAASWGRDRCKQLNSGLLTGKWKNYFGFFVGAAQGTNSVSVRNFTTNT